MQLEGYKPFPKRLWTGTCTSLLKDARGKRESHTPAGDSEANVSRHIASSFELPGVRGATWYHFLTATLPGALEGACRRRRHDFVQG